MRGDRAHWLVYRSSVRGPIELDQIGRAEPEPVGAIDGRNGRIERPGTAITVAAAVVFNQKRFRKSQMLIVRGDGRKRIVHTAGIASAVIFDQKRSRKTELPFSRDGTKGLINGPRTFFVPRSKVLHADDKRLAERVMAPAGRDRAQGLVQALCILVAA